MLFTFKLLFYESLYRINHDTKKGLRFELTVPQTGHPVLTPLRYRFFDALRRHEYRDSNPV